MREDRFERLYSEHARAVLRFLVWRCGDRELAQDVLADTFERVMRTRVRFDPRRGTERAWITSIALNILRDHERREGRRAEVAAEEVPLPAPAEAGDPSDVVAARDEVARALDALTPDEREVVMLRFAADLKLEEIARAIGTRRSTVESRLYKGMDKLRQELGADRPSG